jgi:hypothetical protein
MADQIKEMFSTSTYCLKYTLRKRFLKYFPTFSILIEMNLNAYFGLQVVVTLTNVNQTYI